VATRAGRLTLRFGLMALFGCLTSAPLVAQDPVAPFLRAAIEVGSLSIGGRSDFTAHRPFLDSLYRARGDAPAWDGKDGYDEIARAAIAALRASAERGLIPGDYDVPLLDSIAAAGSDPDPFRRAERELLLTLAILRYLRDLRDGRVALTPFGHLKAEVPIPTDVALLARAAAGTPIESLAREVEPHLAQYRHLLRELARFQALADTFRFRSLAPGSARIGQRYAGTQELRRRLIAYGDLGVESVEGPEDRFDSTLAAGLRRFQGRHALTPDGVLGPATRAALQVRPATRVRQLVLALERLRWLPPLEGSRLLVVNIPAYELFGFDSIGGTGEPALRMPVVIGNAFDHRTPVMLQPLTTIEFHPFWNVPRSILREEILPLVAADSLYLRRARMEVVGPRDSVWGDSVTPEIGRGLARGRFRVRQRPGPWNALGLTKIIFPNTADVYLHGTPDTAAFRRARRDLSHGCIRVHDPARLSEWLLRGTVWDRARIDATLAGEQDTVRATIAVPSRVLLYYATAAATPQGEALFYEDIYGQDRPLLAALAARGRVPEGRGN
jgi:murein L,D-transpeptidase YcbB/YkuD